MPSTTSALRALVVGTALSLAMATSHDATVKGHKVARRGRGKRYHTASGSGHSDEASTAPRKAGRKTSHTKSRKNHASAGNGKVDSKASHTKSRKNHPRAGAKGGRRAPEQHKLRKDHSQSGANRKNHKGGAKPAQEDRFWGGSWGNSWGGSYDDTWSDIDNYDYNDGDWDWGTSHDSWGSMDNYDDNWDWGSMDNYDEYNGGDWSWGTSHDNNWGSMDNYDYNDGDWDWGTSHDNNWGSMDNYDDNWDWGSMDNYDDNNGGDWNWGSEDWNTGSEDVSTPTPGPDVDPVPNPDPSNPVPSSCLPRRTRNKMLSRLRQTTRIVGGAEVSPRQYPFQVSLQDGNFHYCGGSLIAPGWVLTAAHCGQVSEVEIGAHDLEANDECVERIRVTQTIIHPNYNDNTMENDIALLRLERESAYPPIGISSGGAVEAAGVMSTVSGWGTLSSGGPTPDTLYAVNVPVVSNTECNNAYNGDIVRTMLCAGLEQGGKDSCQGDSGGPLFVQQNGAFTQIGVVSWGEGCAQAGKYGVYTRLSAFANWICSTTGVACS